MDAFVHRVGSCPKLKSLTIQHVRHIPLRLGLLLSKVPVLEHLIVKFGDIDSGEDQQKTVIPASLQTISVSNCDRLTEEFVQDFFGALQETGRQFRRLKIERCTSLSGLFLHRLKQDAPEHWIMSLLPWGDGRSLAE